MEKEKVMVGRRKKERSWEGGRPGDEERNGVWGGDEIGN